MITDETGSYFGALLTYDTLLQSAGTRVATQTFSDWLYQSMAGSGSARLCYIAFFIVALPLLGLIETPCRLPNSIAEAVPEGSQAGSYRRPPSLPDIAGRERHAEWKTVPLLERRRLFSYQARKFLGGCPL
ncbi:hypothetical protein ISN39_23845 (plasmid) [Rhizobium sp. 007]|nr:hypothetical protein ISN39_23845 [Rhizobium sp. 007]